VMSQTGNGDLAHIVTEARDKTRLIPELVVRAWVQQVLLGLQHLHTQGVVHRDLKSSAICLCKCRRHIRIGEFGISSADFLRTFSVCDVPNYMSPELMQNEPYSYQSDMWALGCICFELCALTLPFPAHSLLDLVFQVTEADPKWSLLSGHSEEIQDVVRRLLCKEAAFRPTASDVLMEPFCSKFARGGLMVLEELWMFPDVRSFGDDGMQPTKAIMEDSLSATTKVRAGICPARNLQS